MTVRVVDHGANKLLYELENRDTTTVVVGILGSDQKSGADGITVAQVAEWAEFGIGQPERSWLRGWIDAHENEINTRVDKETHAVLIGDRTNAQALARLGIWLQGQLQANIANFPANGLQPNAESTIAHKGSSTPLIDKGQLRSSITYKVES